MFVQIIQFIKKFIDKKTLTTKDWLRVELIRLKNIRMQSPCTIRVLDIGSSDGKIWQEIASGSWLDDNGVNLEVTLFDASSQEQTQENSKSRLQFETRQGVAPIDLRDISPSEFDLITALDVIEHLSKEHGYHLLYEMNRLSETSVIRCPNGFVWQPPFISNPYQAHISAWTPRELRKLGWTLQFGESGLNSLVGIGRIPKWQLSSSSWRQKLSLFERLVLVFSNLFLFRFSHLMAEVVCVRRSRAFDLEHHINHQAKQL
jgi:hypothetical protein